MHESLKKETAKGVFWNGIDKFVNGGIYILTTIILANLLSPESFGLIAIISIFIQIAQIFIDCGFSNALIQKKDRNQTDYSTVFYFNIILSIILYCILWFLAPYISNFYKNPQLSVLTRVIGISIVIGSLISVHKTRLTIKLQFKLQSIITLISSGISAIVAIVFALKGGGVWSLVFYNLVNIASQTILFFVIVQWHPSLVFSAVAFRHLFSFSSKLLGASILNLLYRNLYPIVIGKYFTPSKLAFYNQADTYASYPSIYIGNVVAKVAFPIFSRIQDNDERLKNAYSKYITFSSLAIFPFMIGMIVLAKPLTLVLLKDSWLPMVPLMQILCITYMMDHLCSINLNILYVKGRSDLALRLEFIKKTIAIIIFFISIRWGLVGVCWGRVLYGIVAVYLNSYYTKRLIGLSLLKQIIDIIKPLILSVAMGLIIYIYYQLNPMDNQLLDIITSIILGIVSYLILIMILGKQYIQEIILIKKTPDL